MIAAPEADHIRGLARFVVYSIPASPSMKADIIFNQLVTLVDYSMLKALISTCPFFPLCNPFSVSTLAL